jgi:site-specific DNA-methyltransferase (adenine-specific)
VSLREYLFHEEPGITLYCGDCREILPYVRADLLVTDPPYGIGADRNLRANKRHGLALVPSRDYGRGAWDAAPPPAWLISWCIQSARHAIVWGGNYLSLGASPCWLVWDKDNGLNGYADCELAWTNLPGAVRRLRYRWMGMLQEHGGDGKEERWHPTQKPLSVMRWAIQQAPPDLATILDPFMGSGTAVVAAKDLGRRAIGIERDPRYCEIAVKRLRQGVLGLNGHALHG